MKRELIILENRTTIKTCYLRFICNVGECIVRFTCEVGNMRKISRRRGRKATENSDLRVRILSALSDNLPLTLTIWLFTPPASGDRVIRPVGARRCGKRDNVKW